MPAIKLKDLVYDGVRPERAHSRLEVSGELPTGLGGQTTFMGKLVSSIAVPLKQGAMARTIRVHELLHANKSNLPRRSKFPYLAVQAVEDGRVHYLYWPDDRLPVAVNRDCLSVGLRDIRKLPPLAQLATDADNWNHALLIALRGAAIVGKLGDATARDRTDAIIRRAFGDNVARELGDILRGLKSVGRCRRKFTNLMRSPDDTDGKGGEKGKGSYGAASASPMRVVKLPMPDSCYSQVKRTTLARSGARINRARLARAVATGSTSGLFIRQRYLPGGTFLFDASGSMDLSDERLQALCNSCPAATVAYYSGPGRADADGVYGELVIYSQGGKRASSVSRIHGGNEVDEYAIRWLLAQQGPRVYIGDGGFCGGPEGQDIRAEILLQSAVASGKIRWEKTR